MFFSMLSAALLVGLAELVSSLFGNRIEDGLKLSEDYDSVMEAYSREKFFSIDNRGASITNKENFLKKRPHPETAEDDVYLPIVFEKDFTPGTEIGTSESDLTKMYSFPDDYIERNYDKLFAAHMTSVQQKNKRILRAKDWKITKDSCNIEFESTTTFNSLVTNRAMDYRLDNGVSVRARYEPGPYISTLKESKLSNNFGGDCFLITKDNWILLTVNNRWSIVGKRSVQTPIPYKLYADELMDKEGKLGKYLDVDIIVKKATLDCIFKNRLDPPQKGDNPQDFADYEQYKKDKRDSENGGPRAIPGFVNRNIKDVKVIGLYRDLVEGGKPEATVVARTELTRRELADEFKKSNSRRHQKDIKKRFKKLLWIYAETDKSKNEYTDYNKKKTKEDSIYEIYIDDNHLACNGRVRPVFLHSAIGLELLRKYLKEKQDSIAK